MKRYEKVKELNLEELCDWLDKYGQFDNSPWINWFNKTFCSKCTPISVTLPKSNLEFKSLIGDKTECSYCELEHKCRYFPNLKTDPTNKEIIKMWLEQDI